MAKPTSIKLQKKLWGRNPLSRLEELEFGMGVESRREVVATQLSDISTDLGRVVAGKHIAPASTATSDEPTDTGFTGAAMGGDGWTFLDTIWHFVAVAAGVLQVGINTAGKFMAGAGAYILDALGITITGIQFLESHTADSGGTYRRVRRGYQLVSSTLQYLIEWLDNASATNLITTNAGFETGSLATGYSASTNWTVATDHVSEGTYAAKIEQDKTNPLTTNKYAATAGNSYKFSFDAYADFSGGILTGSVLWYNSTPTLLQTDVIHSGNNKYGFFTRSVTLSAPAGATQCEVKLYHSTAGSAGYYHWVDNIRMEAVTEYAALRMSDAGADLLDESGYMRYTGGQIDLPEVSDFGTVGSGRGRIAFKSGKSLPYTKDDGGTVHAVAAYPDSLFCPAHQIYTTVTNYSETFDAAQIYGFYFVASVANSNNADEYFLSFSLAAGTYTVGIIGVTSGNAGIIDLYLDDAGSPFTSGISLYSVGTTRNVTQITTLTVPVSGRHYLKIKVNGTAGADYQVPLTGVYFRKTSAPTAV